ncbi:MAG: NCS1 family nucleobase:cation symporter-1 [Calditrichaeota bacterium]|nr:NCS1 family nucleobase:cation symporter-1 [Calditrichota bacterium]
MKDEIIEVQENLSDSPLFSEHLAPVPKEKRTWTLWNLAAIWVGMAVCIPTYILASYMIKSGVSWQVALIIIGLANLIITVPMVLNGHAGVKYGIPFPVFGRASFGTSGIHIAAIVRAIVACGWFGIQTWIGGLAFYAIWNAITGSEASLGLSIGKFIGFALFWLLNLYFIWKGTESIKWLESFAAPILVLIGFLLIIWGSNEAGGFGAVLEQGKQLESPTAVLSNNDGILEMRLTPLKNVQGNFKANEFQVSVPTASGEMKTLGWQKLNTESMTFPLSDTGVNERAVTDHSQPVEVKFRKISGETITESSTVSLVLTEGSSAGPSHKLWGYLLWLTAMVGFWATMSLSIADITRYARTQKDQVLGQFIGLPGTMVLYSFIGIFVTFAAIANFQDILISQDAPWDPVSLLSRFDSPTVIIISQIFMIIATLSTNIAANVIAPANAFANVFPKNIDFKRGGLITGIIGIIICPWWLLDEISGILIFVSGLLGPVLGILLCDYFVIRKKELNLSALYKTDGEYFYKSGFNPAAMIALAIGVLMALIGYWVPALSFLYNLSWFTGFLIASILYYVIYKLTFAKPAPVLN